MNVVANQKECLEEVLLRALQPTDDIGLMKERRQKQSVRELCNGPGRLSQGMGITKGYYGVDLCGDELFVETTDYIVSVVTATKRINIDYIGETIDYP